MKKILFTLGIFVLGSSLAHAYGGVVQTSHTASGAATGGTVLFTSAPIKLLEVQIGNGGAGTVQVFRSTAAVYSSDANLQFAFDTTNSGDRFPLYGVVNTSYTYINKSGAANVTYIFECVGRSGTGICPGLTSGGHKGPN